MGTSGVATWTETRDQIITRALNLVGAVAEGESPTANQISSGNETLNAMVKAWQNKHVHLWTREWVQQRLLDSTIVVGTDSYYYQCIKSHTSSSLNKPVTGKMYPSFWQEIDTVSGGYTWALGQSYISISQFTLPADTVDIEFAFVRYNGDDLPMEIVPLTYYMALSSKYTPSRPYQIALDRQIIPVCYLYPMPDSTDYIVHILRERKLQDFVSSSDNPDYPERWINALTWGLADDLLSEYPGLPQFDQQRIMAKAKEYFLDAQARDKQTIDGGRIIDPCYPV